MKARKKTFRFNRDIFKEMVLYVADKTRENKNVGSTHFNKILFYADALSYADYGKPISGETYTKEEHGQFARDWFPVLEELQQDGKIVIENLESFGHTIKKPVPAGPYRLQQLSGDQQQLIDEIIEKFASLNATEVAETAHRHIAWKVLAKREAIPYEMTVLFDDEDIPDETMQWAEQEIENYSRDVHE